MSARTSRVGFDVGGTFTDFVVQTPSGELVTGILACVLLALALDALIVVGTRLMTPWTRVAGGLG